MINLPIIPACFIISKMDKLTTTLLVELILSCSRPSARRLRAAAQPGTTITQKNDPLCSIDSAAGGKICKRAEISSRAARGLPSMQVASTGDCDHNNLKIYTKTIILSTSIWR